MGTEMKGRGFFGGHVDVEVLYSLLDRLSGGFFFFFCSRIDQRKREWLRRTGWAADGNFPGEGVSSCLLLSISFHSPMQMDAPVDIQDRSATCTRPVLQVEVTVVHSSQGRCFHHSSTGLDSFCKGFLSWLTLFAVSLLFSNHRFLLLLRFCVYPVLPGTFCAFGCDRRPVVFKGVSVRVRHIIRVTYFSQVTSAILFHTHKSIFQF